MRVESRVLAIVVLLRSRKSSCAVPPMLMTGGFSKVINLESPYSLFTFEYRVSRMQEPLLPVLVVDFCYLKYFQGHYCDALEVLCLLVRLIFPSFTLSQNS
jgi:hypothetical protein